MIKKEEKLYAFYKQCLEKNYTDMSDENQALKAKVFAMDLNLRYSNISVLYKEACAVYNEVEERNRIEKERADELAAKQAVQGELILTASEYGKDTCATVYRRPDGSVYSHYNDKRIEGVPTFSAEKGGILTYTYHPSKTVFTGASSGGIVMGGFHQTEAYTTESSVQTGKGSVVMQMGDTSITLKNVVLTQEVVERFKRDTQFKSIRSGNSIICYNLSGAQTASEMAKMAVQNRYTTDGNLSSTMTKLSMAADMRKLPYDKCYTIAKYLGAIANGNYPETDEDIYNRALKLATAETSKELNRAYELFDYISDYKDSKDKGLKTKEKYEEVLQREKEQKVLESEANAKRNKKIVTIMMPCLIALVAIVMLINKVIMPNQKYNSAIKLMDNKRYEDAIEAFSMMEDYKDSKEKIEEAKNKILEEKYNSAVELMNGHEYKKAISVFKEIEQYGDSKSRIAECELGIEIEKKEADYQFAKDQMANGKYKTAIEFFSKLNGYQDSSEMIEKCNAALTENDYQSALNSIKQGNYINAYNMFGSLGEYRDCRVLMESIYPQYCYEKLQHAVPGDIVIFGSYEQDNDLSNGKEEIEWIVLKSGKTKVLMTKNILDCKPYNNQSAFVKWENCSLRAWLNGEFYNEAFDDNDQEIIKESTVTTYDEAGRFERTVTHDKVYILDHSEMREYCETAVEGKAIATKYAKSNGCYCYKDGSYWWLREPVYYEKVPCVDCKGMYAADSEYVDKKTVGVRPVIVIEP